MKLHHIIWWWWLTGCDKHLVQHSKREHWGGTWCLEIFQAQPLQWLLTEVVTNLCNQPAMSKFSNMMSSLLFFFLPRQASQIQFWCSMLSRGVGQQRFACRWPMPITSQISYEKNKMVSSISLWGTRCWFPFFYLI